MLNHWKEKGLLIVIFFILCILLKPLIVNIVTDHTKINKQYNAEEIVDKLISHKYDYEYFEAIDYLFVVEYSDAGIMKRHIAFKGKTSGYIPTELAYGTGNKIKMKANFNALDDENINFEYTIIKHKNNYILECYSTESNLELSANYNITINTVKSKSIMYFVIVLNGIPDNFTLVVNHEGIEYMIMDHTLINSLFN